MALEVKMAENPEGLHVDIEDLIAYLESEAEYIDNMIKKGLFKGEFHRGQAHGFRTAAENFRAATQGRSTG